MGRAQPYFSRTKRNPAENLRGYDTWGKSTLCLSWPYSCDSCQLLEVLPTQMLWAILRFIHFSLLNRAAIVANPSQKPLVPKSASLPKPLVPWACRCPSHLPFSSLTCEWLQKEFLDIRFFFFFKDSSSSFHLVIMWFL